MIRNFQKITSELLAREFQDYYFLIFYLFIYILLLLLQVLTLISVSLTRYLHLISNYPNSKLLPSNFTRIVLKVSFRFKFTLIKYFIELFLFSTGRRQFHIQSSVKCTLDKLLKLCDGYQLLNNMQAIFIIIFIVLAVFMSVYYI